jgi:short-subunit dehydrogenase
VVFQEWIEDIMRSLRDRRAFITGAAAGIGRAIAIELARQGTHLFLVDIDADRLAETADHVRSVGVDVRTAVCDLTDPKQITTVCQQGLNESGGVDLLINNAGVAFYGPTSTMTAEQWDWLLAVNLHAPIQITRELLPSLLSLPDAHIVNMCSIAGLVAGGRFAAYHVSKFGLVGFTEALRAEYGRRGLGVTAVCPGPVFTGLYESAAGGNGSRVPTPPRWVCATPEAVARKTVRAVLRNRRQVLITPMAHGLFVLKRFVPGLLDCINTFSRKRLKAAFRGNRSDDREVPTSGRLQSGPVSESSVDESAAVVAGRIESSEPACRRVA